MKQFNAHRMLPNFIRLFLFALPLCADAQTESYTQARNGTAKMKADASVDGQRWAAFPVVASSPETGVVLGGMLFHFFSTDEPDKQASTIDIIAYGTAKGQYALQVSPNIFLDSGRYRLNAMLGPSLWEANYYGTGMGSPNTPEKYKASNLLGTLTLERKFLNTFVLDILGFYDINRMSVKSGGMLEAGQVAGSTDGTYTGAGLEGGYDTRDNTNAPAAGMVFKYRHVRFDSALGSDLAFNQQNWDIRYYYQPEWPVDDAVLALAATVKRSSGNVPFRYLSSPDGTLVLRGIENGRYRDKDMLALQSELRFPIYERLSGTVFAETAQVAPALGDMVASRFIYSVGGGLRYSLNPDQRFNVRGDLAWVDHGIGLIVNIREAF